MSEINSVNARSNNNYRGNSDCFSSKLLCIFTCPPIEVKYVLYLNPPEA